MTFLWLVAATTLPVADAKKCPHAQPSNGAQQPAQVVTRSTADGVQGITQRAFQPAAIHAVIRPLKFDTSHAILRSPYIDGQL